MQSWETLVGRFGRIEAGVGRARGKRQLEERLAAFENVGGNVEILDWRDLRWSALRHRREWRHPEQHVRGQLSREVAVVAEVVKAVKEFADWVTKGGAGEQAIALEACEMFLEGEKGRKTSNGQRRWNQRLLIARDGAGRVQGVALTKQKNAYINCLSHLASRGEARGTGSALLRAAAQITLVAVPQEEADDIELVEYVTLRGWLKGCLEVEANVNGKTMYLQYGGQEAARRGYLRRHVMIAGAALRSLAGVSVRLGIEKSGVSVASELQ